MLFIKNKAVNYKNLFGLRKYNKHFVSTSRYSKKIELNFNILSEILSFCNLECRIQNDSNMRIKYCPLCEKPHNDEPTNLNSLLIYSTTLIYHCFRCGNKGHALRLIKILSKSHDLSKYKSLISTGYLNSGNTTENDDYQSEVINKDENWKRTNEEKSKQNDDSNNISNHITELKPLPEFKSSNFITSSEFKTNLDNSYLVKELYQRNLHMGDTKFRIILDYLLNDRKLEIETLKFYKVGVSYEKFKTNSYDSINLPCVTYPMFYPVENNPLLMSDREKIDQILYDHYKCQKFYLAKLKIRAIGKEFKHLQRVEPNGAIINGLFGLDTVPDTAEEIIITEGEYDAMAAYQVLKIPSVSLPNGATNLPTQILPYFKRFKRIYLWMDADQAGQVAVDNFSKKLGENKTYIINTLKDDPNGPKDANDALRAGKDFTKYIKQAKLLSGDTIIKVSDIKSEIIQFLSKYDQFSGYKSKSFTFFNKKLKGLRVGEFSILTGETGSGKTTFLTQMSLDFIEQNVPTLWGSFEIKNDKLASLFLIQYARKNLKLNTAEEIEYHTENFEKLPLYMLKFHGSQNIEEVINSMNYAVYNFDIQNIVLDNLQFMIGAANSKMINKFDLQDDIIYKLRKFATEKNVHVTLVIHPRKDEILKISSIFGTGKASQEADNIYILQSYKGIKILEIAKNRFDGTTGKAALGFDKNTSRFFELTIDEFSRVVKEGENIDNIIQERINKFGNVEESCIENKTGTKESEEKPSEHVHLIDSLLKHKEAQSTSYNKNKYTDTDKTKLYEDLTTMYNSSDEPCEMIMNNSQTDSKSDETLSKIDDFQNNIFPKNDMTKTFHTQQTAMLTEMNRNKYINNRGSDFSNRVKQSTYKIPKENKLDDINNILS